MYHGDFLNNIPYTNFHAMNDAWVLAQLKEIIATVTDDKKTITDLKNEIIKALDNLPVEIGKAFTDMLENGELDALLESIRNSQQKAASSVAPGTMQAIIEVVNSYIRQNGNLQYSHFPNAAYNYQTGPIITSSVYDPTTDTTTYSWYNCEYNTTCEGEPLRSTSGLQPTSTEQGQPTTNPTPPYWTDQSGNRLYGMPINCSSFVYQILFGIPYEFSRYAQRNADNLTKHMGAAGYCVNLWDNFSPATWRDIYSSKLMYQKFAGMGAGEVIKPDWSNVRPGDIIFKGTRSDPSGSDIDHCGIVITRTANSDPRYAAAGYPIAFVADAGNGPYPVVCRWLQPGTEGSWSHVAHPSYGFVPAKPAKLIASSSGGSETITFNYTNPPIQNGEIITVKFKAKITETISNVHIRYGNNHNRYDNSIMAYIAPNGILSPGDYDMTIIMPVNLLRSTGTTLNGDPTITVDTIQFLLTGNNPDARVAVRDLKIYKGYAAEESDPIDLIYDGTNSFIKGLPSLTGSRNTSMSTYPIRLVMTGVQAWGSADILNEGVYSGTAVLYVNGIGDNLSTRCRVTIDTGLKLDKAYGAYDGFNSSWTYTSVNP